MSRFRTEPPVVQPGGRPGVLLVNLGTPQSPTRGAVRAYLREFLGDPRVVEIPRILWLPILHGLILNLRPAKSARKYAAIWSKDGSPLAVHTERQAKLLRGYFAEQGVNAPVVRHAMRYGEPSVATGLSALKAEGCDRIFVLPLYPQYAGSTTASVADAVARWIPDIRALPELRIARSFHDHPDYIAALAASVRDHWRIHGRAQKLLMSFHGVPRFTVDAGDPYERECRETARLLAETLNLTPDEFLLTFQSRFGRARWLEPYTQATLERLAREGVASVDVICPGFVSDCLETLEEIGLECKAAFLANGGREFRYIPCLNERHDWMRALQAIVTSHAGDWLLAAAGSAEASSSVRSRTGAQP